jgi:hypothetical protein
MRIRKPLRFLGSFGNSRLRKMRGLAVLTFGGFLIMGFRFNGVRFSPLDFGLGVSLIIVVA